MMNVFLVSTYMMQKNEKVCKKNEKKIKKNHKSRIIRNLNFKKNSENTGIYKAK